MTETAKKLMRDALSGQLANAQDNLYRANAAARGRDVNALWGESGRTLQEIIDGYQHHANQLEAALAEFDKEHGA